MRLKYLALGIPATLVLLFALLRSAPVDRAREKRPATPRETEAAEFSSPRSLPEKIAEKPLPEDEAEIIGRVVDTHGRGIRGASVLMRNPAIGEDPIEFVSEADGSYLIPKLPAGSIVLVARHAGFKPLPPRRICIARPGTYRCDFVLERGCSVSGRVLDPDGRPLAGATVSAGDQALATTDDDGRFEMAGLREEPFPIFVRAAEYGLSSISVVRPNSTGIEIRFGRPGSISGRLAGDPPIPTFSVLLYRYEGDLEFLTSTTRFDRSADGGFHLPNVSPGRYQLACEVAGVRSEARTAVKVLPGQEMKGITLKRTDE